MLLSADQSPYPRAEISICDRIFIQPVLINPKQLPLLLMKLSDIIIYKVTVLKHEKFHRLESV